MKNYGLIAKILVLIIMIILFFIVNSVIDKKNYYKNNTYITKNEFLRTIDCAEIFDKYSGCSFKISFDASSEIEGDVLMYMQNESSARYSFCKNVHMTPNVSHYEIEVTPILVDSKIKESFLSFYGTYGTGVIPKVQFISIKPVEASFD